MRGRRNNTIYSPCVSVCTLDVDGKYCLGCARSINEINEWLFLSDEEKLKILKQLPERKKKLNL